MQLKKTGVIFDSIAHTYTTPDGILLQGITGMIERQLFPDKYSGVPEFVMKKAAERGSIIHSICEIVDNLGITDESEEATNYQKLKDQYRLRHETSEYLVSDNKHFASCIDKVYRESDNKFSLGDIKTTYKLDKEYVSWQLSVYAYMFERQNPGCKVVRLFAIWLRGRIAELVEVERIPDKTIIGLLEAEINGMKFINPYAITAANTELPQKYQEMEQAIIEISEQEKYWKEQKKQLMEGVMKEMVKAGVYSWEGENISFTRKKEYVRKEFDKDAFKKDHEDLYNKYIKEVPCSGSVTLKVS